MTDHVTILTHTSNRIAKMWMDDGTISSYGETKNYRHREVAVSSIHDLSALLTQLETDPHSAVIRGKRNAFVDADAAPGRVRKIKVQYDDVPLHWMLVEIDEFAGTIDEFLAQHLPEFAGVSYHWQMSNSSGHPTKPGLKAHVWFWLKAARTSDELRAWAPAAMDASVLNSVQFHYTAAPVFAEGVTDPVPVRSGFVQGFLDDEVDVSIAKRSRDVAVASDFDWMKALQPTLGWDIDQARSILLDCDPDAGRDSWVKALMALHHELDGSDEGLALADEWSSRGKTYESIEDVRGRWDSFGKGSSTITGKWLLKFRDECNAQLKYVAVDEWKMKVRSTSQEFTLREKVCAEIAKDSRLGDMEREALAQVLQDAFKTLGTKYPISAVRKLIAPVRVRQEVERTWSDGFYWVTDDDQFFKHDSDEWLTKMSFDAKYNRLMPRDSEGHVAVSASNVALEEIQIPTATRAVYLPMFGPSFTMDGIDCVNRYRPSSVPKPVKLDDLGHVDFLRQHILFVCGGRKDVASTLLSTFAWNVQNPGEKMRFAPLLKGVQGDGKSQLGNLMAAVMGPSNVKQISNKVLATAFTGWCEGGCVGVFEELKIAGHNRYEIMNAVKEYITNPRVPCHRKGKDEYQVINVTNYMAFTNFVDALPLDDTDRRWFIIFTPWNSLAEMSGIVGPLDVYFDRLDAAVKSDPGQLRRWLLDYRIPASFKPNSPAPHTPERAEMISLGVSDEEDVVSAVIQLGGVGVTEKVLSSACLTSSLAFSGSAVKLETVALQRMLIKLGWSKVPDQLKWEGRAHRIWTKGFATRDPAELRRELDKGHKLVENDDLF